MKNKTGLFIISGLIILLIAGASVLYNYFVKNYKPDNLIKSNENNKAEQQNFKPAPDFSVFDADGNEVKLSDLKGTPVVVNFWASWCGPCKSEMPDFENAYKKYGDKIHFMIINMTDGQSETIESASEYIDKQGYTFPVYFDIKSEAAYSYAVSAIPASYFINKDGYIVAGANGVLDSKSIERGISMILSD
ncbi:MAG: TlpA family protein disulfide reductase [Clostridia bacterium]|nr:TlpA family protein disulfide reductase [Clostridia bacterium]